MGAGVAAAIHFNGTAYVERMALNIHLHRFSPPPMYIVGDFARPRTGRGAASDMRPYRRHSAGNAYASVHDNWLPPDTRQIQQKK